jgi:hypothetical protein
MLIGFAFFFVIGPIIRRIPSFASIASAGIFMTVVSVFLFCYLAYIRGDQKRFVRWLASTPGFPVVTIIFMGFASFGAAAASTVWMLVLRFFKPRWLGILAFGLIFFIGLTLFVNWMKNRETMRASVWGQQSIAQRVTAFTDIFHNFTVFNFQRQEHLEWLDLRLNQNDLVGKAIIYTGGGKVPFAKGYTLWVAATAWIPRIIWPGKPASGGSGKVVSFHTGQTFGAGTSIGAGQVLELYVNFGTTSVIIGFALLGMTIGAVDLRAGFYLSHGDFWHATRWLLPGLGMINAGGLMGEVVASFAANALFCWALHKQFFAKFYEQGIFTSNTPHRRGSKSPRQLAPNPHSVSSPRQ